MRRLLFVCAKNRLRSPTAEQVFSNRDGLEVTSAGLNNDADVPLTGELLAWADLIFVMEKAHLSKLRGKFKRHLRDDQRVICLDIPDDYDYMQPELVALLEAKIDRFLG